MLSLIPQSNHQIISWMVHNIVQYFNRLGSLMKSKSHKPSSHTTCVYDIIPDFSITPTTLSVLYIEN